jgi:predicted GIY-YIG superfamily endonuclease
MITGNIYKIINNQNDDIYIGSTVETLSKRMSKHRYKYREWKAGTYVRKCMSYEMFDEVGLENCQIILIENQQFRF